MSFKKGENSHTQKKKTVFADAHQARKRERFKAERKEALYQACEIMQDIDREYTDCVADICNLLDPYWAKQIIGGNNE